jgi:hypothetical protein
LKNIQYSKYKLNNENKLDLTVLLIIKLPFLLTRSNLVTQYHYENNKEKNKIGKREEEERRERGDEI